MKNRNRNKNPSENSEPGFDLDKWLDDYMRANGISHDGPAHDVPEFRFELTSIFLRYICDPDAQPALAAMQGFRLRLGEAHRFLADFVAALVASGWDPATARMEAERRLENDALSKWAEYEIGKILLTGDLAAPPEVLNRNPRLITHLTIALLMHLGAQNDQATTAVIQEMGFSGDIPGLIERFVAAWRKSLRVTCVAQMKPADRELNGEIREPLGRLLARQGR